MAEVWCIGGASIDRKYHILSQARFGTSNPARARRSFGGVARNVAENLARLGASVALFSIVGRDENAEALLQHAKEAGVDAGCVVRDPNHVTPEYAAIMQPDGDLILGVADMQALDAMQIEHLERHWNALSASRWVFVDCNVPASVLAWCIDRARSSSFCLAIDAVSEPKVRRLPHDLTGVDLLVLNEREAAAYLDEDPHAFAQRTTVERVQALRDRGAAAAIVTRGAQGVVVAEDTCVEVPAVAATCVDATGAGDALVAAILFRLLRGDSLHDAARAGCRCAALTIESPATVRPDLHARLLAL